MADLISIVMPAYRAGATIVGAVESVLAQTCPDWRLIIIADDGTDYEALLGRAGLADPRLVFLDSGGIGSGASSARNAGLEAVTSRYGALLDADDRLKPQKLARLFASLADHAIVTTAIEVTDADLRPLRRVGAGPDRPLTAGAHKWINFSMDAMLGWDRQKTDARFDPSLPNMNDLDFLLRLYADAPGSFHIGEALHLYVKQPLSLSNGAGMTERMVAAKTVIRERLATSHYRFADPDAAEGLDAFLAVSLEAERLYPQALAAQPGLIFEDHIEPLLMAAATSAS